MTNDETTTSTFACGINQSLLDALCSKTGPAAAIVREVHGHNSRDVREEFYASAAVSRLTHIVTLGNALRNRDGAARVYEVGDGEEEVPSHDDEEWRQVHLVGANVQSNREEAGYCPDNLTEN